MKKTAFMVMPFEDKLANEIYHLSTKPICNSSDLKIKRSDELFTTNPLLEDIISAIEKSIITIVDISGGNPNVFYELGIAHIFKQNQTIIITHDDYASLPSDIKHFRIIKYDNSVAGNKKYEEELRKTIELITNNLKLIHKDDFQFAIELISSLDKKNDIYILIALSKLPTLPNRNNPYYIEGHDEKDHKCAEIGISIEDKIGNYDKIGFIEFAGDKILLTPNGKAFVELAEEKGFILDCANGITFTKGYVPDKIFKEKYEFATKGDTSFRSMTLKP